MNSSTPTTPPSHRSESRHRAKPISRLTQPFDDNDDLIENHQPPIITPTSRKKSTISPSLLHLSIQGSSPVPLQDLLLFSHSPLRRPKPREEGLDPASAAPATYRKTKSKVAAAAAGLMGCASPRNARRARRRLEKEIVVREERGSGPFEDDAGRARKRRQSRPKIARKEKLSLGSPIPSSSPLPKDQEIAHDVGGSSLDSLWELFWELVMWNNVAKSTLLFGFGSIFFLSSYSSREFSFSVISMMSQLGILILALAFFYDSFPQRQQLKWRGDFQLSEEDVVRAARVILPVANAALAKARELFSGDPSTTLKVVPILLFTAKYGHLMTLWRISATGFFLSFTAPKLYSRYSQQIHIRVENMRDYVYEAWKSCRHKRFLAAFTATVLWNLFSIRTRIYAAFISAVILRYHHQHRMNEKNPRGTMEGRKQEEAMAVAEESKARIPAAIFESD